MLCNAWATEREEHPTDRGAGLIFTQVVEDVASCLGDSRLEMTTHIARNHMEMCRFSDLQDPEYRKVVAALEHIQGRLREGCVDTTLSGS